MSASTFRLDGRHVLGALLVFFAAVIAINVAFTIAAVRTFPGEDERRSYTQGLRYNDLLAERRAQAALGWRVRSYLAPAESGARIVVVLHDGKGLPLEGAAIDGVLRWPPAQSGDRTLAFKPLGEGRYGAEVGAITTGRWTLRARAHDGAGRALDFEAELTWPTVR
jgi:nitrogen fixation protein FixH